MESAPDVRRVHVTVRGRVQGVGYRESMRVAAERAGVSGWVRNRPDGSVEAEAEGPVDRLDQAVAWMSQGPPAARVDTTEVEDRQPCGDRGFEVR